MQIRSICPYCGCGCKLIYVVDKSGLVKMLSDPTDPVSNGSPCIKGLSLHELSTDDRFLYPLIRTSKQRDFEVVRWNEALNFIHEELERFAPDEIFLAPSGKITNEDCYVMQKFGRIVLRTTNIDACCSRLCHIATVHALNEQFNADDMIGKMDDVLTRDCLLIIGSNPSSNYPVLWNRILDAKKKGTKIISVQTIVNPIAEHADLALTILPGTEIVLLNTLMAELLKSGNYAKKCEKFEGFENLKQVVSEYTPTACKRICGINGSDFERFVTLVSDSRAFGIIHGMGLTQHTNALQNVHTLFNLLILKQGLLLSSRGEINVQGAGDMGCSPTLSTLGQSETSCELFQKEWKIEIPFVTGKNIIQAMITNSVRAAIVSSFNPAQSLPALDIVHKNLKKMFLVCCESFPNLTTKFANVVLPTPLLFERIGTVTTGERRLRSVDQIKLPAGEARSEWRIFGELAKLAGYGKYFNYRNEQEITQEIVRTIPAYSGIEVSKIYAGEDGWVKRRSEKFLQKFIPEEFKGLEEMRSEKYPFMLTTFRSPFHFLTGELTRRTITLKKLQPEPCFYINPEDAKQLGIKPNELIVVSSETASVAGKARLDEHMPRGVVGTHVHFSELLVNRLFPAEFDPLTSTPNYKLVAVRISKTKRK